jgi:predicted PurR-regulated permease PerM/methylmalonyl-CoA mutase cobalamin-binding subunit
MANYSLPKTEKQDVQSYFDSDQYALLWITLPICLFLVATTALYFGRTVLLPLALAAVLSLVFSSLAARLEQWCGKILSAALVVILIVGLVASIGYFLTIELTTVAGQVAGYSTNIANKIASIEQKTPPWLELVEEGVSNVQKRLQKVNPVPKTRTIITQPEPTPLTQKLKPIIPVVQSLVVVLLTVMLLFFLLYSRKDIRDRMVRLAARARISIASEAIDTMTSTVGRYLLLFLLINASFGIATGVLCWILGLPSAALWGLTAFILRFIPYVGATGAASLPTLVAFAIFPGWSKALEILGGFVVLDQVAGQIAEPFIIGHGVGVSPVALLVAAMYWSWLWGIPGLLLSTPLTACLKVIGDYVPSMGFLSIMLGADRTLDDYHDFYRMLLELNPAGASNLALRYCDENGLQETFNGVIAPALVLMGEERSEDHISQDNQRLIIDTCTKLVGELGGRFSKPRITPSLRVLGITPPGETHNIGLLMLLELFRKDGVIANYTGEDKSTEEICDLAKRMNPAFAYVSVVANDSLENAIAVIAALKSRLPDLRIVAGGASALLEQSNLIAAGCYRVCSSSEEALYDLRRYMVRRASRVGGGVLLPHVYHPKSADLE